MELGQDLVQWPALVLEALLFLVLLAEFLDYYVVSLVGMGRKRIQKYPKMYRQP
jgi:hypothetical protein